MDIKLTKDADALIRALYKEYKRRQSTGMPKIQAVHFGSSDEIQANIFPQTSPEDVDFLCRELQKSGLARIFLADNIVYDFTLSDEAIVYMENRLAKKVHNVFDLIAKIKSLF